MSVYKCSVDNDCFIQLSVDKDNDLKIYSNDNCCDTEIYLDRESAQKLANELNQLLMEGKGNE